MAKKFMDGDAQSSRSSLVIQDGSALTLTNKIRILWDSSVPNTEVYAAILKIAEAINQQTG